MIRAALARGMRASANFFLRLMRRLLWPVTFKQPPQVICIHRVGQIGDMICAIPAISAIRATYPNARLVLLTSPGVSGNPVARELASAFPWVDRVWVYYVNEVRGVTQALRFLQTLRAERFDLWIELPQDLTLISTELRNMVFARLVGARHALGFRVNTVRIFARQQIQVGPQPLREAELLLRNLDKVGISSAGAVMALALPESDRALADTMIQKANLGSRPLLALIPGGNRASNRWPADRFAEIARRWVQQEGQVMLLGSRADRELAASIAMALGTEAANLCGETTLMQTAALLDKASAVVTNDTGPMHLAAALGRPCVVPFSARDFPNKWYPWGEQHVVLRKQVACSPCFLEHCPFDNRCLTKITVDEVWTALTGVAVPAASGKIAE